MKKATVSSKDLPIKRWLVAWKRVLLGGNSLAVSTIARTRCFHGQGPGWIPSWGSNSQQGAQRGKKKKKKKGERVTLVKWWSGSQIEKS